MDLRKIKGGRYLLFATVPISMLLLSLRGGKNTSNNSLIHWNFPVSNSSIVIDESPQNLTGAQVFVKADLTLAQARKLNKVFTAQPASDQFISIPSIPGNAGWTPQKVKEPRGYFKKKDGSSLYFCAYVIGIEKPNHRVLYFYAVTFDN